MHTDAAAAADGAAVVIVVGAAAAPVNAPLVRVALKFVCLFLDRRCWLR